MIAKVSPDPINSPVKLTSGEIGERGEIVRQNAMREQNPDPEYVMENVKENPKILYHATQTSYVQNGPNGVSSELVR